MTLLPRSALRSLLVLATVSLLPARSMGAPGSTASPDRASLATGPLGAAPYLIGAPRFVRTPARLAPPVRAANGAIYVPRTLRSIPTQDLDQVGFEGISEPADGINSSAL